MQTSRPLLFVLYSRPFRSNMATDLIQATTRSSDAYRLLAACFYEPDREMFIEENLCANLGELLRAHAPSAAEACQRMESSLRASSQEELLVEYSALFLGPFTVPAQPYGSVYLEKERLLMGESTMDVQRIYAEAGVKYEESGPPDHIAIELEFMSFLEGKIAQAMGEENRALIADFAEIRGRFFRKLLAPWAPLMGQTIVEYAELDFYRALGDCLIAFFAAEKQRLAAPSPAPAP